jgi:hypothetical protein
LLFVGIEIKFRMIPNHTQAIHMNTWRGYTGCLTQGCISLHDQAYVSIGGRRETLNGGIRRSLSTAC